MANKKYAIMGATGQIGRVLTGELLRLGHKVKAIGRNPEKLAVLQNEGAEVIECEADDAEGLIQAFEGVNGVFAMIPPNFEVEDLRVFQRDVGEAIETALQLAGVTRVVNLSSIGAALVEGTGPIKGLNKQERRLNDLSGIHVVHLRAGYFMQNLLWSIPGIKKEHVHRTLLKGDLPVSMISTDDIGLKAAELLDHLTFTGKSVLEFIGPTEVTMDQVTSILGKEIGNPHLKYEEIPYPIASQALVSAGMKPLMAKLFFEMYQAFNDGKIQLTQPITPANKGKTTIEQFAKTFAKVYKMGSV